MMSKIDERNSSPECEIANKIESRRANADRFESLFGILFGIMEPGIWSLWLRRLE
jgi:hypothetical protein